MSWGPASVPPLEPPLPVPSREEEAKEEKEEALSKVKEEVREEETKCDIDGDRGLPVPSVSVGKAMKVETFLQPPRRFSPRVSPLPAQLAAPPPCPQWKTGWLSPLKHPPALAFSSTALPSQHQLPMPGVGGGGGGGGGGERGGGEGVEQGRMDGGGEERESFPAFYLPEQAGGRDGGVAGGREGGREGRRGEGGLPLVMDIDLDFLMNVFAKEVT